MNLIIDEGNTAVKLALFEHEKLIHLERCTHEERAFAISELYKSHAINASIYASVGSLYQTLPERSRNFVLDRTLKFPFLNRYKSPDTLGVDRMVLAAGACFTYPKQNVLIIDAGTCITYDVVDAKKQYWGGAISPGLSMRFKAMNAFTARLPLLEYEGKHSVLGYDTNSSMISGVLEGIVGEISHFISSFEQQFGEMQVILTGGDTENLAKAIKKAIFANSNFLLESMNNLLNYNLND